MLALRSVLNNVQNVLGLTHNANANGNVSYALSYSRNANGNINYAICNYIIAIVILIMLY